MLTFRLKVIIAIVLGTTLLAIFLGSIDALSAAPPRNVSLVYFRGESLGNAARLEWQTATELETAAFKVERAAGADGPFTYLGEIGLVSAMGSATSGHTYVVTDSSAETGLAYWYRLIEVELDNSEHALQTIEVAILTTPTPEPVGGGGDDATATPLPTSTVPATATPQATEEANNTPVASPTSTARATATSGPRAASTPTPDDDDAELDATFVTPTRFSNTDDETAGVGGGATAVAQATQPTSEYPGPDPTIGSSQGYPAGAGQFSATQTPGSTNNGTTGAVDTAPPPLSSGAPASERAVGSGSNGDATNETEASGGGTVGRILLWIGFIFALVIFGTGAFFAIFLSTRRPPQQPPGA